jgi:phage terminase large subunit-like protein
MNYITEYVNAIHSGKCVVSRRVRMVYERLETEALDPAGAFIFDQAKAERPIQFIEKFCRHSKGEWAGRPVQLELFQKAFISALFGFINKSNGFRRFRLRLYNGVN